jgi:hypothetical protein
MIKQILLLLTFSFACASFAENVPLYKRSEYLNSTERIETLKILHTGKQGDNDFLEYLKKDNDKLKEEKAKLIEANMKLTDMLNNLLKR